MKNMKKLVALFLTFIMVMGLGMTAMADGETYTITIDNATEGHTYEAYQIFAGDIADGKLSNITWGSGIKESEVSSLGNAEIQAESLTDETQAKAFAVEIEQYLDIAKAKESIREGNVYKISGLKAGYYLIKDEDNSLVGDASSYTAYILKLSANATIEPKAAAPTSYKKVDDTNDSAVDERGRTWQDSADYDIGDNVPFQLTGTLPENFGEYITYKMIFHDHQSAGLTFNPDSVKVYVKNLSELKEVATGYDVVTENLEVGCTFEVRMNNVRDLKDSAGEHISVTKNSMILVEYTSKLNEDAAIGSLGNPNTMFMEYSNNPNKETEGETGKTKEDTVIVFTYKTIINKVDEESEALPGAAFKLEKKINGEWTLIKEIAGDTTTTFEFIGLDDGVYRLTETDTPEGYNTIAPVIFEIIAQHEPNAEAPKLTFLDSNQIDESGLTIIENIIFSANEVLETGTISADIVNKSGATLPETGGMGTTMFYLIGGILVIGAGVILITRKRMGK